jgi:hypothetical protein
LGAAARRNEVVVVERDPIRTHLGQPVDGLHGGQDRPGRLTEQVARLLQLFDLVYIIWGQYVSSG